MPLQLTDILGQFDENQGFIMGFRPFEESGLLREIQAFYRVSVVFSSNAIEGCSYTLAETKILLEDGLTAGGKPLRDAQAVIGHGKAYDHMFTLLHNGIIRESDLTDMHRMFDESLDNQAVAGAYRDKPAYITGSAYPVAEPENIRRHVTQLLEEVAHGRETAHPLALAAQLHKKLAFIHPFADGNGRIARLAMNTLLLQKDCLPVVIPPTRRRGYIESLEKAHENDRDFVRFIGLCALETQKEMIRLLKGQAQCR